MTTLIITNEDLIITVLYSHAFNYQNVYTALCITRELTILHYVLKYYLFKSIFFVFHIEHPVQPPPPLPFPNDQVDQRIPLAGPRTFIEVIEYIAPLGRGTNFIWSVANDWSIISWLKLGLAREVSEFFSLISPGTSNMELYTSLRDIQIWFFSVLDWMNDIVTNNLHTSCVLVISQSHFLTLAQAMVSSLHSQAISYILWLFVSLKAGFTWRNQALIKWCNVYPM